MSNQINHYEMANAIRALSIDAIETANSGHPGLPLGMADVATVLFSEFLNFDAKDPDWINRDRFILSGGHGSMLLYSLLYLLGYEDMSLDEIKNFRQLGSKTAGHPEYGHAKGIETTTGPLGQGLANAVGMALSEKLLSDKFGNDLVNHKTFVMAGDGDLMEGISQEAISLAGHLKLKKLTLLFDSNNISIDGPIAKTDSTNQIKRFEASGWNVTEINGHNTKEIFKAIKDSNSSDKPTMILCKTIIGYGSPNKQGTASVHGSPLGPDEYNLTRKELGIKYSKFQIPAEILKMWRSVGIRGQKQKKIWADKLQKSSPSVKKDFKNQIEKFIHPSVFAKLNELKTDLREEPQSIATRKASEICLKYINDATTITLGGSADLTGSNNTKTDNINPVTAEAYGRYIHYGIREHAMGAIMNGVSLHGGFIPYGGTFLIFSDYCRPAIRLAALMQQQVIYVLTHDSIGLGEDGPTHQPIEQLSSLRAIPNVSVFRPGSAIETVECWELVLENKTGPSLLALSRQNLNEFRQSFDLGSKHNPCKKGAYCVASNSKKPEFAIFASGSEVNIAIEAYQELSRLKREVSVYSVPCLDYFNSQDNDFRKSIISNATCNIVVEAGVSQGWDKILRDNGIFIGMSTFGASGPYKDLYKNFNITKERIIDVILNSK
ncbi:MAG: transketolase [Pseudomonadota bacterium]|nr:transketolase [Pseudomonadota bacterium]